MIIDWRLPEALEFAYKLNLNWELPIDEGFYLLEFNNQWEFKWHHNHGNSQIGSYGWEPIGICNYEFDVIFTKRVNEILGKSKGLSDKELTALIRTVYSLVLNDDSIESARIIKDKFFTNPTISIPKQ